MNYEQPGQKWPGCLFLNNMFYKDQAVMSTRQDTQGEKQTKEHLDEIVANTPPRFPLGQHHDMSKPYCGYMENFRVVPIESGPGEWMLIADIHIESGNVADAVGGFSYGWTTKYRRNQERVEGAVYLPYPHYNDEELVDKLLETSLPLEVGKWHKKAADPEPIGLIVTFVLFVLAPTWQKLYDTRVHPYLTKLIADLKEKTRDLKYHYGFQIRDEQGRTVSVYLIPTQHEPLYFSHLATLKGGVEAAMAYLTTNDLAKTRGVHLLKLRYDSLVGDYVVFSVQFCDGTVE
jgi:hypothetical protein